MSNDKDNWELGRIPEWLFRGCPQIQADLNEEKRKRYFPKLKLVVNHGRTPSHD